MTFLENVPVCDDFTSTVKKLAIINIPVSEALQEKPAPRLILKEIENLKISFRLVYI